MNTAKVQAQTGVSTPNVCRFLVALAICIAFADVKTGAAAGQALNTRVARSAIISQCGGARVHAPRFLTLFCGDAGETLINLRWRHWGAATATATGQNEVKLCVPSCAAGEIRDYPVKVAATHLRRSGRAARYQYLTVNYVGSRPSGNPPVEHFKLKPDGPVIT